MIVVGGTAAVYHKALCGDLLALDLTSITRGGSAPSSQNKAGRYIEPSESSGLAAPADIPGRVQRAHWGLPDPADAGGGDDEEKLAVFRKIRDELVDRLNAWCAERDREAGAGHAPGGSA